MAISIDRLLKQAQGLSDEKVLSQILGNRIDQGSEHGGLISVKQFNELVRDMLAWRAWAHKRDEATPVLDEPSTGTTERIINQQAV